MKAFRLVVLVLAICASALAQKNESLKIGPGDLLHIQVYDTPELDQHPRVTDAGTVPLLFIGEVKLVDMTPADAANTIEQLLISKQLMKRPQVAVTIDQFATQSVSVLGQVAKPGAIAIATPRSVVDVLSLAGGVTELADRHITIQRHADGKKISYFLSNQATEALNESVLVYPGDTVIIPKSGIVYVLGDVGHPGGYTMATNNSQMSALQAVAMSGSMNKTSLSDRAILIRKSANGYEQIHLALGDIQKGKQPDVLLQADDVVFVPFSYMKNLALNGTALVASTSSALIYTHP
jgi:polysaccharide export outer membrane protein